MGLKFYGLRAPGPGLPEGLVRRPEPAHITAGSEDNQPEQGQAKIGTCSARNPPGQAGHEVYTQSGTVNWKGDTDGRVGGKLPGT